MLPVTIKLTAQDLVKLQQGSKCQIMGELWKRLSEAIAEKYNGESMDDASSSSSTPASSKTKQD